MTSMPTPLDRIPDVANQFPCIRAKHAPCPALCRGQLTARCDDVIGNVRW